MTNLMTESAAFLRGQRRLGGRPDGHYQNYPKTGAQVKWQTPPRGPEIGDLGAGNRTPAGYYSLANT